MIEIFNKLVKIFKFLIIKLIPSSSHLPIEFKHFGIDLYLSPDLETTESLLKIPKQLSILFAGHYRFPFNKSWILL